MRCFKDARAHTKIEVTTNSMPNHCYNSQSSTGDSRAVGTPVFADIVKYQWTVDFNMYPLNMKAALGAETVHDFNMTTLRSQRELDDMLCTEGNFNSLLIDHNMEYSE